MLTVVTLGVSLSRTQVRWSLQASRFVCFRFKKKLVGSRFKWPGNMERIGDEKVDKDRGREEDRECDGKAVLSEIWKEWEENGEQPQKVEGVGEC